MSQPGKEGSRPTFFGDNTYDSLLNQGTISTGDGSHIGNINHFHHTPQQASALKTCIKDLLHALGEDPDDYRQTLEDRKGPKTQGTCDWILESTTYRDWSTSLSGILWISDDAGKGKTMLALHLFEVLKKKPSAGNVIHFFCSREHGRNDGISILRALIYQLLIQQPGLFDHIAYIYDKHRSNLFSDNKFQTLWTILDRMVRDEHLDPVSCILDGLDECNEDSLSDFWMKFE